ncbi:MAG: NTP transferase domain-containing protein [Candidatus Hodarchaeota archaeon]
MKAIILAAGASLRMLPLTKDIPKCLLPIGGKTILEYQIDLLRGSGISDIIIVNGFAAQKVEKIGGNDITYIYNKEYLSTNSIYSLYLAKDYLDNALVLLNADIIIDRQLMKLLLKEPFPNAILADFSKELLDGEMNVTVNKGFVTKIGKDIPASMADGESVQVCKFDGASALILKHEIVRLITNRNLDKFPAYAFKPVINTRGIKAVDTKGSRWIEIDNLDDYEQACNQFHEIINRGLN